MKPRPFPYAAGHPANHGYVQCADCGCQRPESAIARVEGCPPRCFDVYGCKRLAQRSRVESDARGLEAVWVEAQMHDVIITANRATLTNPDQPESSK